MKKWEYDFDQTGGDELKKKLLLRGNAGWELVSVTIANQLFTCFFKRPKA
jgi:hypothetical protein